MGGIGGKNWGTGSNSLVQVEITNATLVPGVAENDGEAPKKYGLLQLNNKTSLVSSRPTKLKQQESNHEKKDDYISHLRAI